MVRVALQGVRFFAFHGFYPEERVLGNHFIVDVDVEFLQQHHFTNDEIAHTVNYEQLYIIVAKHMKQPRKLLETVVQAIIDELKTTYPFVETIRVGLKKLSPPLPGIVEHSFIEITYHKPDDV
ncbi:dihydroneopterin aldolase [Mucilaginibacter sp. PPCGB 2223]|uniref:dihydroneopterin aldolase n=1 Tax=Mucilaginibacter sp. PPCGB 2223 TaxID=1886027 RepID=UPI000826ABD8|nr:dihydroneopterin aldolase [Mucilaginibacter sp. PPCGB 2223]OCX51644.1 dihydroneopterin aldolase [Mucilaginibacter sp. PPCGB 2223]